MSVLKLYKKISNIIFVILIFVSISDMLFAKNNNRVLNVIVSKSVEPLEILNQLGKECNFTILIEDKVARDRLKKKIFGLNIQNRSLIEIFDILIKNRNLEYLYRDNILKIKGIVTKTFKIDYITSDRMGKAVLNASVQSSISDERGSLEVDENQISTKESFNFWKNISKEILAISNSGSEDYLAKEPIINQNAGLLTITATPSQINRIKRYLKEIKDRLNKEVLIDVSIISVVLDKSHNSGVNWEKFMLGLNNPDSGTNSFVSNVNGSSLLHLSWSNRFNFSNSISFTLSGLMNFLKTQGYSKVISNPKILTLNNQQALITIGDNINYRIPKTSPTNTGGTITSTSYTNASTFVGILLNIMPQISDDNEIILRINPSISSFKYAEDNIKQTNPREIAPDTSEKKLSTVVRVKSGETIILGGLINRSRGIKRVGIPILKELPIIGRIFRSKSVTNNIDELIFVITPRVITDLTHYKHH